MYVRRSNWYGFDFKFFRVDYSMSMCRSSQFSYVSLFFLFFKSCAKHECHILFIGAIFSSPNDVAFFVYHICEYTFAFKFVISVGKAQLFAEWYFFLFSYWLIRGTIKQLFVFLPYTLCNTIPITCPNNQPVFISFF